MWLLASPLRLALPTTVSVGSFILTLLALVLVLAIDSWRISHPAHSPSRQRVPWWGYVLAIVVATGIAFVQNLTAPLPLRTFLVAAKSMEPNLFVGERFVAATAPRFQSDIGYGDIIMFRRDGGDWVKRVVALPGDRVAFSKGSLILNGTPVPLVFRGDVTTEEGRVEQFLEEMPNGVSVLIQRTNPDNTNFDEVSLTVPARSYFVLGDNRDRSSDSRVFGVVSADDVTGRATFVYWSGNRHRIGQSLATR
jgi:signal peptidase I